MILCLNNSSFGFHLKHISNIASFIFNGQTIIEIKIWNSNRLHLVIMEAPIRPNIAIQAILQIRPNIAIQACKIDAKKKLFFL